jgi:hypothetical protein
MQFRLTDLILFTSWHVKNGDYLGGRNRAMRDEDEAAAEPPHTENGGDEDEGG